LAYLILPSFWHLVVWPEHDGDLSLYAHWLTVTHVRSWHRRHATGVPWLHDCPLPLPQRWLHDVNKPETESELPALRRSAVRGPPYGDDLWQQLTAKALGLESALRPPRGPPKEKANRET
jgi:hypothetical protein